jgi:hypothetical protein
LSALRARFWLHLWLSTCSTSLKRPFRLVFCSVFHHFVNQPLLLSPSHPWLPRHRGWKQGTLRERAGETTTATAGVDCNWRVTTAMTRGGNDDDDKEGNGNRMMYDPVSPNCVTTTTRTATTTTDAPPTAAVSGNGQSVSVHRDQISKLSRCEVCVIPGHPKP